MSLTSAIRAYIDKLFCEQEAKIMEAIDALSAKIDEVKAEFEAYVAAAGNEKQAIADAVAAQKVSDDAKIADATAKLDALGIEIKAATPVPASA